MRVFSREPQEVLQLAIVDKRADSGQRGPLKKRRSTPLDRPWTFSAEALSHFSYHISDGEDVLWNLQAGYNAGCKGVLHLAQQA